MKEETSIDVKLGELFYELEDHDGEGKFLKYFAYMCEYISGETKLEENSVEAIEMKKGRLFFNPVWIPLSELQNIVLYPRPIKDELIAKYL